MASLVKVGTGFHPELTGRENICLNGAILNMSHEEIRRKVDEIVGVADVETFLDMPVKHYSSVMSVRLDIVVAAHNARLKSIIVINVRDSYAVDIQTQFVPTDKEQLWN